MKNNFLGDFKINNIASPNAILIRSNPRTVCILHNDGKITEHPGITNPWKYLAKVKNQAGVKSCWIKNEE
jgi:hypothetical protein